MKIAETLVNPLIIKTILEHCNTFEEKEIIGKFIEQFLEYEHLIWNQNIQGRDIIASYEKIIEKLIPEDN